MILQQLLSVWNALDARRRLIVSIATVSVFALVLLLAKSASTPTMSLLYSGLEPSASGEVVTALEQRGVAYKVQGNAIYVDATQRDLMRMSLASDGLPASGTAGYELLDNLTGFGTTSQMFDTAYWRAREGELARTILAWPQVKSVRVHIANPVQKPFVKSVVPVASVTLKLSAGILTTDRARALQFLVASAVSGLSPDDVSIIDSDRGLVGSPEGVATGTVQANNRAAQLKADVERLLTARVGRGNAIVAVSVDTVLASEKIVERRFDPDSRVAISSETTEVSGGSTDSGGASVTVASNLPSGDAGTDGTSSKTSNSETREIINFEVSETTRELISNPGKITRISVAVLLNNLIDIGPDGTITQTPRPSEELALLTSIVESAIGYNSERGDTVTLQSLDFQPPPEAGTLATASPFAGIIANSASFLQLGLLGMVILGLGLFVVRPILLAKPVQDLALLPTNSLESNVEDDLQGQALGLTAPEPDLKQEAAIDPIENLRQIISERQDETVEVLRNWIETSEERV
jgi:flagellar M-ring protein FliF